MNPAAVRRILYAGLVCLLLLHNDLWLWTDSSRWLGLPAGLTYHLLYCLTVTLLMWLVVRYAWPSHLSARTEDEVAVDP